jgi:hypothetical protein
VGSGLGWGCVGLGRDEDVVMRRAWSSRQAAVLLALAVLVTGCGGGGAIPDLSAVPAVPSTAAPETSGSGSATAPDPEPEREVPYDGPTVPLTVWVDGWSLRTVGVTELTVTAQPPDAPDGFRRVASLVPATVADIELLGVRDISVIERLMARLVRFDVLLECDSIGCSSQRGPLPFEWLVTPASVPSLGAVYSGWGVEHGVWTVTVDVPAEASGVALGLGDWTPHTVEVGATDSVLSAAFGTVFELVPTWVTGEGILARQPYQVDAATGAAPASGLPDVLADGTAFWRGLAAPVPGAGAMHPSVLTMLSSPTFGCNGALCVPGVADVTFETVAQFASRACTNPAFPDASDLDGTSEALVAGTQLRVTTRLPHPVRQIGAGLPPVEEWDGHIPGGVGPYTGDAPLSEGELTLVVQQAWLFVGDALTPHIGYVREPKATDAVLSAGTWDELTLVARRCR